MNDPRKVSDERLGGPSRPPLGEELLPPVEQPSAKFIIQLFVVPALIVMAIVGVWLSFSWLVRTTTLGPEKLIEGIDKGPSVARWQRASELADMLHNKHYASLRRDQKSASQLAQILERELDQSKDGAGGQEAATLRYFLTRALGEFDVQDGTETLLRAAQTKRSPEDELVRRGAIEALAVRAYNLSKLEPPEQLASPELEPVLVKLSNDEDAEIRYRATYALGKLGTPAAIERLEALASDPDADTRYNAAVALAHRGNATAMETLAEMLDLSELAKAGEKTVEGAEASSDPGSKQALVVGSALEAAVALKQQNPQADMAPVIEAVENFIAADPQQLQAAHIPPRVKSDAEHLLQLLKGETQK